MWRLALRNCTRRRLRSVLALVGVAIGASVVVALVGLAEGVDAQLGRAMTGHRGDLLLLSRGAPLLGRLTPGELAAVAAVPGVAHVAPYEVLPRVEVGPHKLACLAFEDPGFIERRFRFVAGRAPLPGADEVALGAPAAATLAVDVGGAIEIRGRRLAVVGRFVTDVVFQDRGMILPLDVARGLFQLGENARLAMADLAPGTPLDVAVDRIHAAVPTVDARPSQSVVASFDERRQVQALVWGISVIALLAGAAGVLNTMTMNVLERTREIGLLLAVGWRPAMVRRLIVWEGCLLSVPAGFLGFALGVGYVHLADALAPELTLTGDFGPSLLLRALGLAVGVGLVGSLLPAVSAARLDPIEALRYE